MGAAHEHTEENPCADCFYCSQHCKVLVRSRAAGEDAGVCFLYSARVERSFLVGFLTDCLMLLDFFSLVGGILGD